MDEDRLASERDAIYGLPLDRFVEERDRRAKALRADDLREEAAVLAKARKPTVPAWAVDQLARREPQQLDRLLRAGEDLRDAQRRAASGRGAGELRDATRTVRDVVSDLRRRADAILSDAGSSSAAHLEDVERTLFTAAVTPEHHDALRRGVLERPLEGAGFGGVEGLLVLPGVDDDAGDDRGPDDAAPAGSQAEDGTEADAEARRREEEHRREQERRRLGRHESDLERSHRDQARRAERADAEAEKLRARADEAEEKAAREREEAQRIAAELDEVRRELAALDTGG